jgi:hypothetical protein
MTWPGLTHDFEHGLFMFHLSRMSYDKEGAYAQEIWMFPNKIAESDIPNSYCLEGLGQPHYSIQHIGGYDLLFYKVNTQDLHPLIIETEIKSTVLVP